MLLFLVTPCLVLVVQPCMEGIEIKKKLQSPLIFFVVFGFAFLFHLLFLLSLTPIMGIFYCLNYTLLLLHLITTQLVSHLSLSSTIFSISTLIISIFYCLNYILLLLHLIIRHLVIDFYNNYVIKICPRQLVWFK